MMHACMEAMIMNAGNIGKKGPANQKEMLVAFKIVMFPKCGLLKTEDHLYPMTVAMTVAFANSVALRGDGWGHGLTSL